MRAPHAEYPCGCSKVDNVYFPTCGNHEYEDLLNFEAQEVMADWYESQRIQSNQAARDVIREAEDIIGEG